MCPPGRFQLPPPHLRGANALAARSRAPALPLQDPAQGPVPVPTAPPHKHHVILTGTEWYFLSQSHKTLLPPGAQDHDRKAFKQEVCWSGAEGRGGSRRRVAPGWYKAQTPSTGPQWAPLPGEPRQKAPQEVPWVAVAPWHVIPAGPSQVQPWAVPGRAYVGEDVTITATPRMTLEGGQCQDRRAAERLWCLGMPR